MMAYACLNMAFPKVYNKQFKQWWHMSVEIPPFLKYIINTLNNESYACLNTIS